MGLTLTTPPATEPVSAAELKLHSRIDTSADDAKVAMFITAAREYVESVTGRQCITATYTLTMDRFPLDDFIELPAAPLQSVTSVSYFDADNSSQTFSSGSYEVDTSGEGYGRIYVDRSVGWPTTYNRRNAVTIVYDAGYGDAATDVPERIVQLILLIAADWYENRESNIVGVSVSPVPGAVKSLLDNLKVRGGLNSHAYSLT